MIFWGAALAGTAIAYIKGKLDGVQTYQPAPDARGLAGVNWFVLAVYVSGLYVALKLLRPVLKKLV